MVELNIDFSKMNKNSKTTSKRELLKKKIYEKQKNKKNKQKDNTIKHKIKVKHDNITISNNKDIDNNNDKVDETVQNLLNPNTTISKIQSKKIKKNKFNNNIKEDIIKYINDKSNTNIFTSDSFQNLNINDNIKKVLNKCNYNNLTKIQKESFNSILDNKNVILKSETGSGKTMAYSLPIIQNLINCYADNIQRSDGVYVLIICPTRELVIQVYDFICLLTKGFIRIVPGYLIGGEDVKKEKSRIRKGINILVTTPGRLLYHTEHTKNLTFDNLKTVIFEECDRTLDIGFKKEILLIIEKINLISKVIQIILVAATLSKKILEVFNIFIESKTLEIIGFDDCKTIENEGFIDDFNNDSSEIPKTLKHYYINIGEKNRLTILFSFLKMFKESKFIIFTSTADQANFLENILLNVTWDYKSKSNEDNDKSLNIPIYKLHGYIDQKERINTYKGFNKTESGVLISTDIGGRGLDFKDVKIIIIFDIPEDQGDYINRVGRTARISNSGIAVTFLIGEEKKFSNFLIEKYNAEELRPGDIFQHIYNELNLENEKEYENAHVYLDYFIKTYIQNNSNVYYLARRAFNSFCRAYSRLKDKETFNLKQLYLNTLSKAFGLRSITSKNDETKDAKYNPEDLRNNKPIRKRKDNKYNDYDLLNKEFM